jgi:O-antigen ligase
MTTRNETKLASQFWLVAWAVALSWSWLLPNHYLPWSTFHMDAWAAAVLMPMAGAVLWRTREQDKLSLFGIVMLGVTVVPWIQYGFGLISLPGTAWIAFAYLLGFALAILVGQRWELHSPAQLGDGLFFAIGIAALTSVGLQLHQWLQLNILDVWSMGNGFGRPFANFGQPNQLGTLLLWGVLALIWGTLRSYMRPVVMVVAAVFLLFGLALTESRTAWIGVVLLLLGIWYWRTLWPSRSAPWLASALALCFFIFVWAIPHFTVRLLLSSEEGNLEKATRLSSELRPQVWALFLDALRHRPWFGYGWNQVATAHLEVAPDHPPIPTLFAHSHNLFLDLLLWCGIPLGLILSGFVLVWLWRRFRAIRDGSGAVMFLLVVVVGNHAMLELPLHHAYFLLPTGLFIGALDARLRARLLTFGQRWLGAIIWLASASLLAIIIRDYSRIESSYQVLRFEWANIRVNASRVPPEVLVLGQLRDLIVYSRFEPSDRTSPQQLDWMLHVASIFPSAGVVHKLAAALVWNDRPQEAVLWLRRMCAISPHDQCDAIKNAWKKQSQTDPRIAAVPWP